MYSKNNTKKNQCINIVFFLLISILYLTQFCFMHLFSFFHFKAKFNAISLLIFYHRIYFVFMQSNFPIYFNWLQTMSFSYMHFIESIFFQHTEQQQQKNERKAATTIKLGLLPLIGKLTNINICTVKIDENAFRVLNIRINKHK